MNSSFRARRCSSNQRQRTPINNQIQLSQVNAPKNRTRAQSTNVGTYHAKKFIKSLQIQVEDSNKDKTQQRTQEILKKIEQNYDDKWEECLISNAKLSSRSNAAGVVYNETLYVYGGFEMNKGILGDFWKIQLNQENHKWERIMQSTRTNPGPRCRHGTFIFKDNLYLFGGMVKSQKNSNDLYEYNFQTKKWKLIQQQNPIPPIDSFQLLEDYQNNAIYLIGGFQSDVAQFSNGVHRLDLQSFQWSTMFENNNKLRNIMSGRISLGAVLDAQNQKIYCFGGYNGEQRFNDLWTFDINKQKWNQLGLGSKKQPVVRSGACLQLYNNELIIFGGLHQITHELDDLYSYNLETNQWKEIDQNTTTKIVIKNKNLLYSNITDSNSKKSKQLKSPMRKLRNAVQQLQQQSPKKLIRQITKQYEDNVYGNNINESETNSPEKQSPMFPSLTQTNFMQKGTNDFNSFFGGNSECMSPLKNQAEIKYKKFMARKNKMLQEFSLTDQQAYDIKKDMTSSPLSTQMQYKLENLGNPNPKQKIRQNKITDFGRKTMCSFQLPLQSKEKTKIGKKPCARDGALSILCQNKILIFGGDRHQFSFNDLFYLNLEKLYNSNKEKPSSK